jgi:hypothetical protein
MKNIIIGMALIAITAASCNSGSNNTPDKNINNDSTNQVNNSSAKDAGSTNNTNTNVSGSMQEMVSQYLQMKNALANDNGNDAATAGNAFVESMGKMDKTNLTPDKKKIWNDISDDAKEMAEHIGKNAGDIAHQREHFDMLSKDMLDMVKAFGTTQTLYNDYCPMYNNKKGASWLSETKDIKNPYLGKKMPTCGEVKEEIKQ